MVVKGQPVQLPFFHLWNAIEEQSSRSNPEQISESSFEGEEADPTSTVDGEEDCGAVL